MAQLAKHHQFRAANVTRKPLTKLQRNQPVAPTPQQQRGHLDLGQVLYVAGVALFDAAAQRSAVACAQCHVVVQVHQRGRDLGRVAVHRLDTFINQTAGQGVEQQGFEDLKTCNLKAQRNFHRGGGRLKRVTTCVHQDQAAHPLRQRHGGGPGNLPAE